MSLNRASRPSVVPISAKNRQGQGEGMSAEIFNEATQS